MIHRKYYFDKTILIPLLIFIIISITTIYNSEKLLIDANYYYIKQLVWYGIGFIFIFLIMKKGNKSIYKYAWNLYVIGNILLLLLLLIGKPINEAKCWFTIKGIGTVQPSEFMKIILIIVIARLINEYKDNNDFSIKSEFKFLMKIFIIVLIPSILTFLEPDTGVVIIYFLITIIMLFISGIRYRWFCLLFIIMTLFIGILLLFYFKSEKLFISIFGNSFFLRIHRLLDWSNNSGYQLENSLISIGSGGIFGHGFNISLYFPEPQTDFIFTVYASCFGLIGVLFLLSVIGYFDIRLILISKRTNNLTDKYVIIGIIGMMIYQQFQNISMTFGLMPITGITLPFISYGGSSLLSYMIMMGIIFNVANKKSFYQA